MTVSTMMMMDITNDNAAVCYDLAVIFSSCSVIDGVWIMSFTFFELLITVSDINVSVVFFE